MAAPATKTECKPKATRMAVTAAYASERNGTLPEPRVLVLISVIRLPGINEIQIRTVRADSVGASNHPSRSELDALGKLCAYPSKRLGLHFAPSSFSRYGM